MWLVSFLFQVELQWEGEGVSTILLGCQVRLVWLLLGGDKFLLEPNVGDAERPWWHSHAERGNDQSGLLASFLFQEMAPYSLLRFALVCSLRLEPLALLGRIGGRIS